MAPHRLPNLRLPQADQRNTWSVLGSVLAHGLVVLFIIYLQSRPESDPADTKRPGLAGERGGGGGVRYITLDAAPPAAAAQPALQAAKPPPEPVVVPPPDPVLTIRKLDMPLAEALAAQAGVPAAAGVIGSGGGAGGGQGPGIGRDSGPGTGGEGGDTFPPQVKYTILPLPRPNALKGRSLQVHFWVDAQGRVTRVKVDPEIKDAAYRAQFVALLRKYEFEPARKLDGTRVDGETTITITL
ncbi:MAG: hypothetical protein EXR93_00980 [Gemmatimonadetes bacterium]|nr:hypothetical protein [Gemmatimonadota bacterium]